jgi:hypothetical protein
MSDTKCLFARPVGCHTVHDIRLPVYNTVGSLRDSIRDRTLSALFIFKNHMRIVGYMI